MLHLVLFGPPGAGKGTQSEKLVRDFDLTHLSTGDIFRHNIRENTALGKWAKTYIDKGELVPDEVTIGMLKEAISAAKGSKGFIFDGFPRTVAQAEALDSLLQEQGHEVTIMISLNVPEEELLRRLMERGKQSGRTDDTDENIIRNRIQVYNDQTAIAAAYYENKGKHARVNGLGTIEDIYEQISQVIQNTTG
jgi:adenylate kinase